MRGAIMFCLSLSLSGCFSFGWHWHTHEQREAPSDTRPSNGRETGEHGRETGESAPSEAPTAQR